MMLKRGETALWVEVVWPSCLWVCNQVLYTGAVVAHKCYARQTWGFLVVLQEGELTLVPSASYQIASSAASLTLMPPAIHVWTSWSLVPWSTPGFGCCWHVTLHSPPHGLLLSIDSLLDWPSQGYQVCIYKCDHLPAASEAAGCSSPASQKEFGKSKTERRASIHFLFSSFLLSLSFWKKVGVNMNIYFT